MVRIGRFEQDEAESLHIAGREGDETLLLRASLLVIAQRMPARMDFARITCQHRFYLSAKLS